MKEYNVHEVLSILQKYYITDSQQMVTRWIREGKLRGIRGENRKEGYMVDEDELFEFIEEQRPGLPAIMGVYEGYVIGLNPEDHEEEVQSQIPDTTPINKIAPKENNYEIEVIQLKDQVINLENTISILQEEHQTKDMRMVEIMEQSNMLIENKITLKEENTTLNKLLEMMNEVKDAVLNPTKSQKVSEKEINKTKSNEEKITNTDLSLEQISNNALSRLKLNKELAESDFDTIYKAIFNEDGLMKAELVMKNGTLICPYTKNEYKQQKRFIDSAIKSHFKILDDKKQEQEQLQLAVEKE